MVGGPFEGVSERAPGQLAGEHASVLRRGVDVRLRLDVVAGRVRGGIDRGGPRRGRRICPDIARQDVYVCGPDAWMASVETALAAAGVPRDQVHVEHFSW